MIPLAVPVIGENERKYLLECIETNFVSTAGPFVGKFEQSIANACGAEDCVAVNSGTSAIHLSLIACGVGVNDLVIAPDLTFIASINAIAYCGAEPWLMDISPDSWTISAEQVLYALKNKTEKQNNRVIHKETGKRVAAIMAVYTLGCPAEMDKLSAIAKEYDLPLIADAAAALGAKYKNKNIADCADFTTFSFNGNKTITSGGGGAVVSTDISKLKFIRHISTTARVGREYIHDEIGYNYRITNIEAAVGLGQIEKLSQFLESKRRIRKTYDDLCSELKNFEKFPSPEWAQSANWFSGVVLKKGLENKAESVLEMLNRAGIEGRAFWRPISTQRMFKHSPKEDTQYADNLWKRVITLPCSTNITDEELLTVIECVRTIDKEL